MAKPLSLRVALPEGLDQLQRTSQETMNTPEPEQTSDSCKAICPYCGHSYQVESEDYDAEGVEEYCSRCGCAYVRHTEFDVTHYCTPKTTKALPTHP